MCLCVVTRQCTIRLVTNSRQKYRTYTMKDFIIEVITSSLHPVKIIIEWTFATKPCNSDMAAANASQFCTETSWIASEQRVCCGGRFVLFKGLPLFLFTISRSLHCCISYTLIMHSNSAQHGTEKKSELKTKKQHGGNPSSFVLAFLLHLPPFKCHPIWLWLEYTVRRRKILWF